MSEQHECDTCGSLYPSVKAALVCCDETAAYDRGRD